MSDANGCEEIPRLFGEYDYDVLSVDRKILTYYNTALSQTSLDSHVHKTLKTKLKQFTNQKTVDGRVLLQYSDVMFLHKSLKKGHEKDDASSPVYLCELMELSVLHLPSPAPLVRSAEYKSKMNRLRLLADEAEYQKMTKNVSFKGHPTDSSVGKELKQMDSQVTFLLNFVLTVLGAFVFGYKGVEYSLDVPNVSLQLTVGVTLATIVFFADIYFIIMKYV